jgi:hypothetical protein
MPASAIAIQITAAIEHPIRLRREFAWPPQVTGADVTAGFEGLPGRVGVFQGSTLTHGREVSFFVWFGRSHPTAGQLDRANSELRRTRFR